MSRISIERGRRNMVWVDEEKEKVKGYVFGFRMWVRVWFGF